MEALIEFPFSPNDFGMLTIYGRFVLDIMKATRREKASIKRCTMPDSTQFNHKVPVTSNENQIPYFDPSRHEN